MFETLRDPVICERFKILCCVSKIFQKVYKTGLILISESSQTTEQIKRRRGEKKGKQSTRAKTRNS